LSYAFAGPRRRESHSAIRYCVRGTPVMLSQAECSAEAIVIRQRIQKLEEFLQRVLILKQQIAIVLSGLACLCVTACWSETPGPIVGTVYVIVSAEKPSSFTTYLATLVHKYGMTANLGQATDDKGHSVFVLDATSPSVRLRSENVLLSGNEEPKMCGIYTEPHSDPGQYFITVSPSTQTDNPRDSRELLVKIMKNLKEDGYDVRLKPVMCSAQSKLGGESRGNYGAGLLNKRI
jgi:hypothetical protein